MEILSQAERFIESQGFHLMTKDEIPKFARCAAESYGDIYYALDDYFVGHPLRRYQDGTQAGSPGNEENYRGSTIDLTLFDMNQERRSKFVGTLLKLFTFKELE